MATPEEMKQAHDKIDELNKALHPEPKGEEAVVKSLSIIDKLLSFAGIGTKLDKSAGGKEEPAKTEETPAQPTATETITKSLAANPEYQEIRDGSEALKALEDAMSKSIGTVDSNVQALSKAQGEQGEILNRVVLGLGLIAEAQTAIIKSLETMPKSIPMSGYFGLPSVEADKTEKSTGAINFEEVYLALEKGVHAGRLNPDVLMQFQAQPVAVLKSLSEDMRKSLGIPAV